MTEGYLVPDLPSGGFFREEETVKRSRFIVTVGRAASPEAAHAFIEKIREEHSQATHNCWAFNAGEPGSTAQVGASDDGEPKGTAGRPMLTAVLHSGIGEVVVVVTRYFGGILLAMFINNKNTKGKKFWRTCFMVAMAVPQFVSLLLVRNFFADLGIVNTICKNIGLTDWLYSIGAIPTANFIPFLTHPAWARPMIILINIWVGIPYQMLIATGILMNIPTELIEAAKIDGANAWQSFKSITMPYILFITGPSLVNSLVANINNFNVIWLLSRDVYTTSDQLMANANANEVDLLVTWLYRLTQDQSNYKMASVIGILVFVVCAILTLVAFSRMIKGDKEESFQ